jgi:hypothetical protein
VSKAVSDLRQAEARQTSVDPAWPMRVAIERSRAERAFSEASAGTRLPLLTDLLAGDVPDLVASGVRALKHLPA